MKLKKANAVLAILSEITLLIHVGYSIFAYLTFYYNPTLKVLTALPFMVIVCLHAICGMCAVFLLGDGTRTDTYPKLNKGVLIQRISAALIFPLLILHLNTYDTLKSSAEKGNWVLFAAVILAQILFFAVICAHIAVSFSKPFITLGMLKDRNKQKLIDKIAYIVCGLIFAAASVSVIRTQLMMFIPK